MKRYFLGIDISKNILTVYDGKDLCKFKNKEDLKNSRSSLNASSKS
jgi:hypothetical protein